MPLDNTVVERDVADMTEFSQNKQVRKMLVQSQQIVSEFVCYEPGQATVLHKHPKQDEVFYIIGGTGAITFADSETPVETGSMVFVPAAVEHGVSTGNDRLVILFTKGPGVLPRKKRGDSKALAGSN